METTRRIGFHKELGQMPRHKLQVIIPLCSAVVATSLTVCLAQYSVCGF